jgi:Zn-dependent metalloprotease
VASVSPADAVAAAEAAPGGYRPKLAGIVPRLNYYFDAAAGSWRLVYILEDVPVSVDRSAEAPAGRRDRREPPRFVDYVVDGHQGTVVAILPRTPSLNDQEQQMGTDAFGISRTFLAAHEDGQLVLWDQVHNVRTYDFGFADPTVEPEQLPGEPIVNPPDWTPDAVSAHVNAVAVSEFLRGVLRRDNIDNRGSAMVSTINCVVQDSTPGHNEWHNAFWDGTQMVYGQALHGGQLRTLAANVDVVAHEMFHGVTDHTARLEYRFQSGALNESYSDIFGTIVANFGKDDPRGWDWLLGEKLLADDQPFRDLSDPTRFGQPAHMDDFVDLPDTNEGDSGGVHTNSGIHNKAAFNLLTAEDDHGGLIMTPDEVAAICYLALTQRLSRTSQFVDSLRAVRASARTFLRNLPAAVQEPKIAAIEAAFAAVGIAEPIPLP